MKNVARASRLLLQERLAPVQKNCRRCRATTGWPRGQDAHAHSGRDARATSSFCLLSPVSWLPVFLSSSSLLSIGRRSSVTA